MKRSLHHYPPLTPGGVLFQHWSVVGAVAGLSVTIGVLAAVDGGSVLLKVDEPIQRWVENRRTAGLDTIFRGISRMGSNLVVFSAFAVIVGVMARRCRTLALTLAVAVLARPVLEFLIKELVGRERPDFSRLIDGTGPAHPSGHVLAAVALWGLLPPLVAAGTHRRWLWWVTAAFSGTLITAIGMSRIYLGVHWFFDVIQGLLLGWLYLTLLETLFVYHHRGRECDGSPIHPARPGTVHEPTP